jgi:hypothetical protein
VSTKMPWHEMQDVKSGCPSVVTGCKVMSTSVEPWRPNLTDLPPVHRTLSDRLACSSTVYTPRGTSKESSSPRSIFRDGPSALSSRGVSREASSSSSFSVQGASRGASRDGSFRGQAYVATSRISTL